MAPGLAERAARNTGGGPARGAPGSLRGRQRVSDWTPTPSSRRRPERPVVRRCNGQPYLTGIEPNQSADRGPGASVVLPGLLAPNSPTSRFALLDEGALEVVGVALHAREVPNRLVRRNCSAGTGEGLGRVGEFLEVDRNELVLLRALLRGNERLERAEDGGTEAAERWDKGVELGKGRRSGSGGEGRGGQAEGEPRPPPLAS
jgi:hypothetical protein